MPTFKFADKTTLDFEEFPIEENNLRKVYVQYDTDDTIESVWVAVRTEDLKRFRNGETTEGYALAVILQNSPLCCYPLNAWGLYVPVKLNGERPPSVILKELDI
jgi:hypothetical protein